jgi:hypothetical protein
MKKYFPLRFCLTSEIYLHGEGSTRMQVFKPPTPPPHGVCQAAGCGKPFVPDYRSAKHHKYCSPDCRGKVRLFQMKAAKKRWLSTKKGKAYKQRENLLYRLKLDWKSYILQFRKVRLIKGHQGLSAGSFHWNMSSPAAMPPASEGAGKHDPQGKTKPKEIHPS